MGKVHFPFVLSHLHLIDSLQTYSCDVDGCGMVFSRDFKLRKHKVKHEDSNRCGYPDDMTVLNLTTIDRLSYCEWPKCDFYTLDPKRLVVHFATQ